MPVMDKEDARRLRRAVKLLDAIETWADRTDRLPDYVEAWLQQANGLVAVTIPIRQRHKVGRIDPVARSGRD